MSLEEKFVKRGILYANRAPMTAAIVPFVIKN